MHLLCLIIIIALALLHLQITHCDDLGMLGTVSSSSNGGGSGSGSGSSTIGSGGFGGSSSSGSSGEIGGTSVAPSISSSESGAGGAGGASQNNLGSLGPLSVNNSMLNSILGSSVGPGSGAMGGSSGGIQGGGVHERGNPGSMGGAINLNGLIPGSSGSYGSGAGGGHGLSPSIGMGMGIGGGGHPGGGGIGMMGGGKGHGGTLSSHGGAGGGMGYGGGHIGGHGGHATYGQGHALSGLANLGIIVPGSRYNGMRGGGGGGGMSVIGGGSSGRMDMNNELERNDRDGGGGGQYYEHFISEHTVMAVFTSQGQVGGPCLYMPATRRQNHQCRKETYLPETIREARNLAISHCENQFRYDRWNCSIETRGKRNIFKKLYKETAFVHALTAAAMTHSIARACAEGRMTKCSCGQRKKNHIDQDFQWGGCNDNLKHGKRVTRSFLDLRGGDGDEVTEILRHDSEVGIEAVSTLMKDKCKCHGVSGSCSMKTCWKKLSDFNSTATLLRQKYNQAIRKAPSFSRIARHDLPPSSIRMKKPKQRRKKQQSQYTTLYYLETSPTYCSVTKDRQCLHPDNCANLCCGRGYTTRSYKQVEKCRCRFNNGRCCQLICDYCQRFEDKYFCK